MLTINNVKKIIDTNKWENKIITFDCGDENIEVEVSAAIPYEKWYTTIQIGVNLMFNEDAEGNERFLPSVYSTALGYATVVGFTDIDEDAKISDVIMLASSTDIVDRIKDVLPAELYYRFEQDFRDQTDYRREEYLNKTANEAFDRIVRLSNGLASLGDALENLPLEAMLEEQLKNTSSEDK